MDQDQQRLSLEGLIRKLRSVTLSVQIMPFAYTLLYIISMVLYMVANDTVITVLDTMFYVSPIVVIQFLILSRSLRLCRWHRIACSLPLIPQFTVLLDRLVVFFSESAVRGLILTITAMCVLLLVSAYKVFFGNGC